MLYKGYSEKYKFNLSAIDLMRYAISKRYFPLNVQGNAVCCSEKRWLTSFFHNKTTAN